MRDHLLLVPSAMRDNAGDAETANMRERYYTQKYQCR